MRYFRNINVDLLSKMEDNERVTTLHIIGRNANHATPIATIALREQRA